jgi:hypothetical protein
MDRFQLCQALRTAGVPEAYYEIPDCPGGPRPADHYFLEQREGTWVVGVHERGRREVRERFPDEDRACEWLYDRLTDEGSPPAPATPEELDEILHDSEHIQRRAREELKRAVDKARRRTHDGPPVEPPTR